MYSDPTKIRSHIVKIRLSDEEHKFVQAYVDYTGEQKAAFFLRVKGLAQRMRKSSGKTPASNVMKFHKGKR